MGKAEKHSKKSKSQCGQVRPTAAVQLILADSLRDADPTNADIFRRLAEVGIERKQALILLATHKSSCKYGFEIQTSTINHLLELLADDAYASLLARPFFLTKACWAYEHAPAFMPFDEHDPKAHDQIIIDFAVNYRDHFLHSHAPSEVWTTTDQTTRKRLFATAFWERESFDPVALLVKAREQGLEGLELSIDFHPFNLTKLLPEELDAGKRLELREVIEKSQLIVDLHSAIIGPYATLPSPAGGAQVFYDPLKCRAVQFETIDLAKDIGARDVNLHFVNPDSPDICAELIQHAAGSGVRVTIENYYQTEAVTQTSENFLNYLEQLHKLLPPDVVQRNFGVTIDVGHLNIEGEDPLVGAILIGKWCHKHGIYLRMHATDNYGLLLFAPPAFSADVHGNVSGKGINNGLIIQALRSLGLPPFSVVAEQIRPLTKLDIDAIHDALTCELPGNYAEVVEQGRGQLAGVQLSTYIEPADLQREPYCFVAGLSGAAALQEYVVCRTIQDKKHLSVDEAMKISQDFMQMPTSIKRELTSYIDDLLLPVQTEIGTVERSQLDLICQNINGALFWSISNENMSRLFSDTSVYSAGKILCEQHKPGQEMFFIKEGEVGVYIENQHIAALGPGEIFGEISLFYNIPRSATIKTEEDGTVVGTLTRSGLESLLESREPYVCDLILRLYKILPSRLRNMNSKYQTAIRALSMITDDPEVLKAAVSIGDSGMEEIQETEVLPKLSLLEASTIYERVRELAPGTVVCTQGEEADGIYFILEGRLQVSLADADGESVDVALLEPGEVFGEIAVIEGTPRSATVRALEASRLGFLSTKSFDAFVESGSELAFRFMGYVCLLLFRRILRLDHIYSQIKLRIGDMKT